MAEIRPFKGYRYRLSAPRDLGALVSPPYDMIDDAGVNDLYARDPHNVVRLIQNRREPADGGNIDRHKRGAALFASWIADGTIAADAAESFYIYRQSFSVDSGAGPTAYSRTGVVVLVKLVDFSEKIVFPHENTLSGPKVDRYEHMQAFHANTEQIFGLVPDDGSLHREISIATAGEVLGDFTDANNVRHELLRTDAPATIAEFQRLVASRSILIADGHHRYETALKYSRDTNDPAAAYVMMTLVSMADPGLVIRPFHRLVKKCDLSSRLRSVADLSSCFDAADLGPAAFTHVSNFLAGSGGHEMLFVDAQSNHAFGLTTNAGGRAYLAAHPNGMSAEWNALNVSRVNRFCVEAVMQQPLDGAVLHDVFDYMNDGRLAFDKALGGAQYAGCFFLKPIDIAAVRAVVALGERMPQKSTNFFPKLFSGLVFNKLGAA